MLRGAIIAARFTFYLHAWARSMKLDTSTDPQVGFRPPGALDATQALVPYVGAFGRRQAAHLLRRAGFGGSPDEVDALQTLGPQAAVDSLLHPRGDDLPFADFPDTAALYDVKTRNATAQNWWLDRMLRTRRPLVEKMTLFWHGHFATSLNKVPAALMVEQIDLLRSRGLGNFRTLLAGISKDPAMLVWLDNRYNNKNHPNENYAREVMELFTLGLGNYTEDDVKSAARAFTGWTLDRSLQFTFHAAAHDDGEKTFLGRSGAFDGDDVLAIIVEQPIHQRFICRKLLEFFVYSDPEPELIEALAQTYAESGYDVARAVGTILRSNVFFSVRAYRALPKSPIEFAIGLQRFLRFDAVPADTVGWLARMGQVPLAPPTVKGWDGGPTWINTATLLARFNYVNRLVKTAPPPPPTPPPMTPMTPMTQPTMAAPPAQPDHGAAAAEPQRNITQRDITQRNITQRSLKSRPATPAWTPDDTVRASGGLDAQRVVATIVRDAVQDDVTSDVRRGLLDYVDSAGASVPVPFGPENYQEKIRGALALALNVPQNQLA